MQTLLLFITALDMCAFIRIIIILYCIVSLHLYSTSHSAHQSEVLPLTCQGGTAVVLLSNWVRRTCSRSLHSNCLRRGSNCTLSVTCWVLWTTGHCAT